MTHTLRLNKGFYSERAIDEAVVLFKDECELVVDKTKTQFIIEIQSHKNSERDIALEFCNTCLALMK